MKEEELCACMLVQSLGYYTIWPCKRICMFLFVMFRMVPLQTLRLITCSAF